MWSIAGLRPETLSHKHGLCWLSHMWFLGWNSFWMKMSLDEKSSCMNVHWMKLRLDESVSGWNRFWMKVYFYPLHHIFEELKDKRSSSDKIMNEHKLRIFFFSDHIPRASGHRLLLGRESDPRDEEIFWRCGEGNTDLRLQRTKNDFIYEEWRAIRKNQIWFLNATRKKRLAYHIRSWNVGLNLKQKF